MNTARITIRTSCAGTVNIAHVWVGRKCVYESNAWGFAGNARIQAADAATRMGFTVK